MVPFLLSVLIAYGGKAFEVMYLHMNDTKHMCPLVMGQRPHRKMTHLIGPRAQMRTHLVALYLSPLVVGQLP